MKKEVRKGNTAKIFKILGIFVGFFCLFFVIYACIFSLGFFFRENTTIMSVLTETLVTTCGMFIGLFIFSLSQPKPKPITVLTPNGPRQAFM